MSTPLEGLDLPLECCAEYDAAAEYFARNGHLPPLMGSPGAIDYIQDDPDAFYDRANACKYANARQFEP